MRLPVSDSAAKNEALKNLCTLEAISHNQFPSAVTRLCSTGMGGGTGMMSAEAAA